MSLTRSFANLRNYKNLLEKTFFLLCKLIGPTTWSFLFPNISSIAPWHLLEGCTLLICSPVSIGPWFLTYECEDGLYMNDYQIILTIRGGWVYWLVIFFSWYENQEDQMLVVFIYLFIQLKNRIFIWHFMKITNINMI